MYYAIAAIALAAGASAVTFIGDGVPVIYVDPPYPNPPFEGVQYNATVIGGIPLNSSNEWQCLTMEKYFTTVLPCSKQCLVESFQNATLCDDDDFTCHCSTAGSDDLNTYVIPCLTGGAGTCSNEEIGQFANFVHGGLCPYFRAVTHEQAYGQCDGPSPKPRPSYDGVPPPNDRETPKPVGNHPSGPAKSNGPLPNGHGAPRPITTAHASYQSQQSSPGTGSFIRGGGRPGANIGPFFTKDNAPCSTSIQSTWTKKFDGPTIFSHGSKKWTATEATVWTVTDSPITWTSPISAAGTWAPVVRYAATGADSVPDQARDVSPEQYGDATDAGSVSTQTQPVWAPNASQGFVQPTSGYIASPAQFTGAASRHGLTGAAVFIAAGAAFI